MRAWLVLLPLLLAGCSQAPAPAAPPEPGPSLFPPALLVDRLPASDAARRHGLEPGLGRDGLQLYVHARHGNVRYDFLNLTEYNDFQPNLTWSSSTRSVAAAYALDEALLARVNVTVEAVEGGQRHRWSGRLLLNETGRAPTLRVEPFDLDGKPLAPRDVAFPFETLLQRVPEGP